MKQRIEKLTKDRYKGNLLLLEEVCKELNLEVFEADFEDDKISGQIERSKENTDRFIIYVNRSHPITRKRFTIAQEIGHYISFLSGSFSKEQLETEGFEDYAISYRKDDEYTEAEVEANQIAAEMLMPEEKVNELLMQKETALEDIAYRFGVSQAAMTLRLKDLYPNLMVL